MFTKNAGWISAAGSLALSLSACSGGGSGGASFHVTACTLGCSGGQSGAQVNCGVVGIAENQEIALLFTSPVDPFSVTKESFAVRDAVTGDFAPGTRFIDPTNPSRLIFRPKLTIGDGGEPIFGFEAGRSYVVYLNGTVQNDPQPYVESTGGRGNEARVACTVQASQGVVDSIPGKPSARVFVTVVDLPSGATSQVEVMLGAAPGASDVKTASSILLEFDELMDISSMLDPSTGIAPGISVQLDVDGNVSTTGDRAEIEGSYVFGLDQSAQTTSLAFTPADGFPSLGADESQPRLVVVTLDDGITDIAGNGIESPGSYSFVPQQILFAPATLPAGGEQFTDQDNFDAPFSGSPWGSEIAGRLTPGQGGGSGRHGALRIAAGETLVLNTSAAKASAEIDFTAIPEDNAQITLGDATFVFKTNPLADPLHVPIRYNVPYTVSTLVDVVRAYATANPSSQMAGATYVQSTATIVRIEAVAAGIPSPAFPVDADPPVGGQSFAQVSSGTLSGGFEAHTYSDPEIVTNFDFDAGTGTPGGTPPDLSVNDGVFEFSRLTIEPTGTLVLAGSNPARLLVRGEFELADLALVDLSGSDRPEHDSATPFGQPGAGGGPNAGSGGKGGDRSNQPALADANGSAITLASAFTNGTSGIGVGGVAGVGQGLGGLRHPLSFPVMPSTYNGWAHNFDCTSGMMANTGSGGAYSKDGLRGLTNVFDAIGTTETGTISNKPAVGNTLGGESDDVGLEPPSANPTAERLLSPALGFLRGGSGGGGGGSHVGGTQSDVISGQCFASPFFTFPDSSAAGGGGGGGAVQIQAGGTLTLTGQIDASGGDGGDAALSGGATGTLAAPGGGASGGAVLLQGGTVALAQQPSRIQIQGGDGGQGGLVLAVSFGGDGSPGVLRVEQAAPGGALDAVDVASATFPTDTGDPTSVEWLSSGEWIHDVAKTDAFESVTGSQSCWMQVPGPHYSLTFEDDPAAPALPANMGWNMDVILDLGAGEITVPWRGSDGNGPFLGLYPEEHWGTLLNRDLGLGESAAPIVVRFQGAATHDTIVSPCDADVNDPNGPFQVGSQSAWVRHPRELNAFLPLPSAARFLILFDRSHADFDMVKGVTNLRIETQPE